MGGLCRTSLVSVILDAIMDRTNYQGIVKVPNAAGERTLPAGRNA
jgi:hypothetical protein